MKQVTIYTDGACSGNPGKGGWCAILMYEGHEKVCTGGEVETTNNRMELMAVIRGLEALNQSCQVSIYSDSAYVVNAIQEDWLGAWKRKNWRTAGGSAVKNVDLWQQLDKMLHKHMVTFFKVKGHADNVNNNRCDEYARLQITLIQQEEAFVSSEEYAEMSTEYPED